MARKIMGVEGACRSAKGGGVPFCLISIYQAGIHSPLLPESPAFQKGIESGQNRSKMNKFLVCFGVSSGFSETRRGEI